jgi:hypothetical protein
VLVQNLAPGAAARMGLGYEALSAASAPDRLRHLRLRQRRPVPRQEGLRPADPERGRLPVGHRHAGRAGKAGNSIADIAAGMYAYSGILAALLQRQQTGEGSHIDVSMLEALGEWMGFPMYYAYDGAAPPPRAAPRTRRSIPTARSRRRRQDRHAGPAERARVEAVLRALPQIASAQSVLRLIVGHIDFMADTGMQCARDQAELAPLRFAVAMWTRIHRLAPAVDGVTAAIHDDELLGEDTRRAVRYGFCAKLCIHPRQVPVVHAALAPAPDALNWAQRVVAADAAANGAAVQLDGRMVDAPVVLHARQLLARSRVRASAAS